MEVKARDKMNKRVSDKVRRGVQKCKAGERYMNGKRWGEEREGDKKSDGGDSGIRDECMKGRDYQSVQRSTTSVLASFSSSAIGEEKYKINLQEPQSKCRHWF